MNIIELKNIEKSFNGRKIIDNFSFEIEEGKIYAIVGTSGSGKSTLLNLMGGIEKVTNGEVIIFGERNPNPRSSKIKHFLRYKIAYLFQNYALSDSDTVYYNLEIALTYSKIKNKKESIATALDKVGLKGYENKKVYTLSGGEQQRVAMARLMLKQSQLILADEPTGNLDSANRDIIFELLKKLNQERKTIIIATHDFELAERCDVIINLNNYQNDLKTM